MKTFKEFISEIEEGYSEDDIALGGTVIYKKDGTHHISKALRKVGGGAGTKIITNSGHEVPLHHIVSTDASDWKSLKETLSDRFAKKRDTYVSQTLSRDRDNEHIGNELAKHDINVIKFHPAVDSGDKEGNLRTKVSVDSADQEKAHNVIKSLGYGKTHHVSSPTTSGKLEKEISPDVKRAGSSINWTGD